MALPNYQLLLLPVLEVLTQKECGSPREIREAIIRKLKISSEDAEERLPKGQTRLANRIGWACLHLKKAGLVEQPERGIYCISESGRKYMHRNAQKEGISNKDLEEISSDYKKYWRQLRERVERGPEIKPKAKRDVQTETQEENPEENLANAYAELQRVLKVDLKNRLLRTARGRPTTSKFLEDVAVRLLISMGYGSGRRTGGPKDHGVDGIMLIDELGIEKVAIQTKRYAETKVRESDIRDFVGGLDGKGISDGVFITTSDFTRDALDFIRKSKGSKNIILINGDRLAELMLEHNIGVRVKSRYVVKQIDEDFFVEE